MRTVCAAIALGLSLMAGGAAAQVAVSFEEARGIAAALEAEGQRDAAGQIAAQLLAVDPDDASAWVVVARIRRAGGDWDGALDAARRAHRTADTDDERHAAAVEIAAVHFAQERRLLAQFWLRRAAQVAPSEALRAQAVRNLRAVRSQTPWAFSVGFGVVPTSNVNNGSRSETIEIAGLPFVLSGDARALSGVEATLSGSARYRFAGLGGLPAQAQLGLAVRRVRLSDEARDQAPDAEGSDYAFEAVELGLSHGIATGREDVALRAELLAGRNRYGGEPLSNYVRGGGEARWVIGDRSLAILSASLERQVRFDEGDRSAWVTRLDARRIWQVNDRGDVFGIGGGVRRAQSDSIEIDNDAVLVSADYTWDEPVIGPATLGLGVDLEYRDYDASPFSADGRQDWRGVVRATVGAPGWNFYGFGPTVTFEASRTESNVSLYDVEDFGVRLGIRSVF